MKEIVQCMDNSNWHGEYCIVDMIFKPAESEETFAVLLSNRRTGHHITDILNVKEIE
jgi:hypothetical protein